MITFKVKHLSADVQNLEVPEGISLNLMEFLKAMDYPIAATCRGIAQCGTCHIVVLKGINQLAEANDREMDTLDLLPDSEYRSRLACQIRVTTEIENCLFELRGSKSLICGPHVVITH
jgi:2Fe-2S ferredoxin